MNTEQNKNEVHIAEEFECQNLPCSKCVNLIKENAILKMQLAKLEYNLKEFKNQIERALKLTEMFKAGAKNDLDFLIDEIKENLNKN